MNRCVKLLLERHLTSCGSFLREGSLWERLSGDVFPGMSLRERCSEECCSEDAFPKMSFRECLSGDVTSSVLPRMFFRGAFPKMSLRECFSEDVFLGVSFWERFFRGCHFECPSEAVFPGTSFRGSLSGNVVPGMSFRESFSGSVFPGMFFRGYRSENVFCGRLILLRIRRVRLRRVGHKWLRIARRSRDPFLRPF